MQANPALYPAASSAKVLLNRLKEVATFGNEIKHSFFHGILNSDKGKKKNHIYCYCISFLQMFLHCSDIFNNFSQKDLILDNDQLVHDIVNELKNAKNTYSINIFEFISKWKGWGTKKRLPSSMQDVRNFVKYFLNSISPSIRDLFLIDIDCEEKQINGQLYYFSIPSNALTIQDNIDLKLASCTSINELPKYLLIYLDREENGQGFRTDYIAVNTYITISNVNYKFQSSILFTGSYDSGHYSNIIKIADKYFYFNDNDVYSVFYHSKSTSKTPNIIYDINNGLNRNSVLFLYEVYDETIDASTFEEIDSKIYQDKLIVSKLKKMFTDFENDPNYSKYKDASDENDSNIDAFVSFQDLFFDSTSNSDFTSKLNSDESSESDSSSNENIPYTEPRNSKINSLINENLIQLELDHANSTPVTPLSIIKRHFSSQNSAVDEVLSKNIQIASHKNLKKTKVDIEKINATNLSGTLVFNNEGIPPFNKRTVKGRFIGLRKLFRYAGLVFNLLDYNDLGVTNAEILKDKLDIQAINSKDIVYQGKIAFRILKQILAEGKFDFRKVQRRLMPIVNWYSEKYSNEVLQDITFYEKIDENLEETLQKNPLTPKEMKYFNDKISSMNSNSDDEFITNELNANDNLDDSDDSEEESYDNEDDIFDQNITKYSELFQMNNNSDHDEISEFEDDCNTNDDDNMFFLGEYDWRERVELMDATNIRKKIEEAAYLDSIEKPRGKQQLRSLIIKEFLKNYEQNIKHFDNTNDFIDNYITLNTDDVTKSPLVKEYETIIEKENERKLNKKERKKRKDQTEEIHEKRVKRTTFLYGKSTLFEKIQWYKSLDLEEQENFLRDGNLYEEWGGDHLKVNIVNDDTVDCLLALSLDFPTMSVSNYMNYLNSKYGPNYRNKIALSTVYSVLKNIHFTLKKTSFAPPNRNSVGLRIFRYAWCKFMKRILKNKNILLGFIDEAAVTVNESKTLGRSYIGITPINISPLKKVKMSIISTVFPGFGVIYKFVNKSVNGEEYARFLSDVNEFVRKFICNNETEVVIIEDNCPMHKSKPVEKQLEKLDISLIPIVQYSPSLNGVVEGYFGFVKLRRNPLTTTKGEIRIKREIIESWKNISSDKFTVEVAQNLYREWIARMDECLKGKPLFSGHIEINPELDTSKLTNVSVYRINEN